MSKFLGVKFHILIVATFFMSSYLHVRWKFI